MVEQLPARKRDNSVAVWITAIIVAGLMFYGIWVFLNSAGRVSRHPTTGAITHSTPVGGATQDGVYHSTPSDADLNISSQWRI